MKKNVVPDKVVSGSPCASLAENVRAARKMWTTLHSSLQACFISAVEAKDYVLDPFSLLHVIAKVRSDAFLLAQIGEAPLAEAETWARQEAQAATLAFDGELRNLCGQEQILVEGRFPSYVLEGYLSLRLSPDDRTCTVGVKKVKSLLASRVWPEITVALKKERLRGFKPDDFLVSCHEAYRKTVAHRNDRMGASMPIKDFFRELVIAFRPERVSQPPQRSNSSDYTKEYFRRDLAMLMMAGQFVTPEGAKMELMPTAFPKDGISVNVGGEVRIIGYVAFSEPPADDSR